KYQFTPDAYEYDLSEYRVENVNSVKISIQDPSKIKEPSEILLSEDNYNLIDKFGDGFKETLILDLPEQSKLDKNSIVEISYEYWYDRKRPLKRAIINTLRLFTLIIVAGNLILSIVKFGSPTFWI
ncbi:MAG: hypothetical protein KAT66_00980, partial [Candidatus Lokiarchaeota archaeon]|nr:hypothetical protein [Candidatus Lokiarchaeota archaeon]